MKRFNKKINTVCSVTLSVVSLLIFLTTGCKKPSVTFENFDATNLRVINGFPDKAKVKFYLDTFNLTLNLPTSSFINYGGATIYYVVQSGSRKASFVSLDDNLAFVSADLQLVKDKSYTLFLKGDDVPTSSSLILAEDDLSQPDLDKAKIRVANLSPNSGNIDITFQLDDLVTSPQPKPEVKLFENIDPGSISDYKLLDVPTSKGNAVPTYFTIRIYEAGTQNLLSTATRIDVRGSLVHTLVCRGRKGGSPGFAFDLRRDWAEF
ncbi:MAG: DUF4397 domain-containing protein [Chitinophagaceae bacterium]|nr:DUF4397 domain-containing protein [Chitinophagaceae bacterium]